MNYGTFQVICSKVDALQKNVIGEPKWLEENKVFEYKIVDVKTVSILKAIRAMQGLKSLDLLCKNGLFIDMGALIRCFLDCICEIYFLLETYPEQSVNVSKFVTAFSETTINNHLNQRTEFIETKKIHAATVRVLSGKQDQKTSDRIDRIYKTFCGYIHSNYSHIMQIYGSKNGFNLGGVPSEEQKLEHMKLVDEFAIILSNTLDYMDEKFHIDTNVRI